MPKHCGNTTMKWHDKCQQYYCPKCDPYHLIYCK